jgi:hypothetical protein
MMFAWCHWFHHFLFTVSFSALLSQFNSFLLAKLLQYHYRAPEYPSLCLYVIHE